jgi:integrase
MTGMRRGEVLGLRWRDVDLVAGRAAITQTIIAPRYVTQLSTPKTEKGRRSVELDAGTVEALRSHRKRQAEERLAFGPGYEDNDLVFRREDGAALKPHLFSLAFETRASRAGLPKIRLHDLRHTHATLALKAGEPAKIVSERLGHSSVAITLDIYSHADPGLQKGLADRLAAMVDGD